MLHQRFLTPADQGAQRVGSETWPFEEEDVKVWRVQMYRMLRDHSGMKGELPEMPAWAGKDGRGDSVTTLVDHGDPVDWPTGNRLPQSWHLRIAVARLCRAGESENPLDHGRTPVPWFGAGPRRRAEAFARPGDTHGRRDRGARVRIDDALRRLPLP